TVSGLTEKLLHDPAVMERLLLDLSINVTAMFRDPEFYASFRELVAPQLRTYPFTRIWNAGCASGEETYSLAILLEAAGLYGRTRAFSEYYVAGYDGARFRRSLLDNVVLSQHNLVQDAAFNEFHAIVCRNVMIYFDKALQDRVHRLFYESLATFGVLALGQ